jgi:hypothetical protein
MGDGSSTVQGTARSRKEIDASVQAFSTTEASMRSEVVGRRYWEVHLDLDLEWT